MAGEASGQQPMSNEQGVPPSQVPVHAANLEREKWEFEQGVRLREIALRELEQKVNEQDLRLRQDEIIRTRWFNPLILAICAAAIAAFGGVIVAFWNGLEAQIIERSRADGALAVEVLKAANVDKAAENLQFLLEAGLISDLDRRAAIKLYLTHRVAGQGPLLPTLSDPNSTQTKMTMPVYGDAYPGDIPTSFVENGSYFVRPFGCDTRSYPSEPDTVNCYLWVKSAKDLAFIKSPNISSLTLESGGTRQTISVYQMSILDDYTGPGKPGRVIGFVPYSNMTASSEPVIVPTAARPQLLFGLKFRSRDFAAMKYLTFSLGGDDHGVIIPFK